jgi:hypothetical protein
MTVSSSYLLKVTDAIWGEPEMFLSPRQAGALVDVLRVGADHGLHRRAGGKCLICDAYQRLEKATADVGTNR